MLKKYAEALKALQLFVKFISRKYIDSIPLDFKRESTRFKVKMQPKLITNEPVYSDICKSVRKNTF